MAVVITSVKCLRHDKANRKFNNKAAFVRDYIRIWWMDGTVTDGELASINNEAIILSINKLLSQTKLMRPISEIKDFKILMRKSSLIV